MGARTYNYQIPREESQFMGADAIHGYIGKLFRKTSTVATFDDFVQLCEKAKSNIKVIVLDLLFIYPISKKARTRLSTKVKIPFMESIVDVQLKKGSSMLHLKEPSSKKAIPPSTFFHLLS